MNQAMNELSQQIKHWGYELGFQQVGISDTNLQQAEQRLQHWLTQGYQADMDYMILTTPNHLNKSYRLRLPSI